MFEVHPMLINEAEKVSKIFEETIKSFKYYNNLSKNEALLQNTAMKLTERVKNNPFSVLLCMKDSVIVGYLIADIRYNCGWVCWIVTLEGYKNQGVAKLLLQSFEKLKLTKIEGGVLTENVESLALFNSLGFKFTNTEKNYWCGLDFSFFEKKI